TRLGNSGDFHSVIPMMRQRRHRREQHDPNFFRLRPDADECFRRWIGELAGDPRSMMVVAEEDGRIVGFLLASVDKAPPIYMHNEFGMVHEWWIDPDFQERGAGEALIDRATVELAKYGVRQIRICTPEPDGDARQSFERLGFRSVVREMVLELPNRRRRRKRQGLPGSQNIKDPKTPI
ncbi:MAG TPA: GNAT family N-acetyltransferase, partial [Vicinamibacterales bacterium]|nr:GNAT family N-acetyltransferase [Vicinamibacterales bacterium]